MECIFLVKAICFFVLLVLHLTHVHSFHKPHLPQTHNFCTKTYMTQSTYVSYVCIAGISEKKPFLLDAFILSLHFSDLLLSFTFSNSCPFCIYGRNQGKQKKREKNHENLLNKKGSVIFNQGCKKLNCNF